MSETIQMRQTQTESGDYRVFAAKGDDPVKGLALHKDLTSRLNGDFDSGEQYIEVEFSEGGPIGLDAEKFTGSTFRVSNPDPVRHAYFGPQFVSGFGYEGDMPTDETFDVDGFPAIGISDLSLSDEATYDSEQNSTAEDAADALFGEDEEQDSDETEADSEESEADSDEEQADISDEELGIVEG